jgi:hypothetical protein
MIFCKEYKTEGKIMALYFNFSFSDWEPNPEYFEMNICAYFSHPVWLNSPITKFQLDLFI